MLKLIRALMMNWPLPVILFLASIRLCADKVHEASGNIFVLRHDGSKTQLTAKGADYDPALSCDEKSVVFVRRAPGSPPNEELGTKDGAEIWTLPIQVPAEARRVFGGDKAQAEWVGLIEPQFAADPDTIYFMRWFGNGYELYSLSLHSGQVKRVVPSVREFWVVCNGPFRNDVVVAEDQLKLAGGHTDLYWLYDDKGNRRDLVGTSIEDVKLFFGGKLPHRE